MPFRVIIEDKETWQHVIAKEIQKRHPLLEVEYLFLGRNSKDVIEFVKETKPIAAFSVDVEDLCITIPQEGAAVEECIDAYGTVKF